MIELATRAVACKHWRWMPGMGMWVRYKTGVAARGRFLYRDETYMHLLTYDDEAGRPMKRRRLISDWSEALPDFDDPATLGCLLALVRKAWPIAPATTAHHGCYDPQRGHYHVWTCSYCTGSSWEQTTGDSESEALLAALEAAL